MITPRITRLLRTADLQAFQRAIVDSIPLDPMAARECAVIVPSRSAAEELRRTIENGLDSTVRVMPDLVTRDEWYAQLRERLPGAPAPLTAFHREALLRHCASRAHQAGAEPPFNLRAEIGRASCRERVYLCV